MLNIFLSYTLRDNQISVEDLAGFKKKAEILPGLRIYVDIIDNKNRNDPQSEVYRQLEAANCVWIVNSASIDASPWAKREISLAQERKKPVRYLDVETVRAVANAYSTARVKEFLENYLHD